MLRPMSLYGKFQELSRLPDTQEITAGQQVTVTPPDGAGAQEVAKIL